MNYFKEIILLLKHTLQADLADGEKSFSPLLFALTLLLMLNFSLSAIPQLYASNLFVAQLTLVTFFATQIALSQCFKAEQQDQLFDVMRTSIQSPTAWIVAKWLSVLLSCSLLTIPMTLILSLFSQASDLPWLGIIFFLATTLVGLTALGILVSTLTLTANGREVLFPLLFFPLTIPILLACSEGLNTLMNTQSLQWNQWSGLALGFDVIFITLSILLTTELMVLRQSPSSGD